MTPDPFDSMAHDAKIRAMLERVRETVAQAPVHISTSGRSLADGLEELLADVATLRLRRKDSQDAPTWQAIERTLAPIEDRIKQLADMAATPEMLTGTWQRGVGGQLEPVAAAVATVLKGLEQLTAGQDRAARREIRLEIERKFHKQLIRIEPGARGVRIDYPVV